MQKLSIAQKVAAGSVEDYIKMMIIEPTEAKQEPNRFRDNFDANAQLIAVIKSRQLPPESKISSVPSSQFELQDIGDVAQRVNNNGNIDRTILLCQRQNVLKQIRNAIGTQQVTKRALEFAPLWISKEAIRKKISKKIEKMHRCICRDSIISPTKEI